VNKYSATVEVGVLDTIPEEGSDYAESDLFSCLQHDDPIMVQPLREAIWHMHHESCDDHLNLDITIPMERKITQPVSQNFGSAVDSIRHNYHITAANIRAGLPADTTTTTNEDDVEIEFPAPYSNLIADDLSPGPGETVVLQVYLATARKKSVVKRD
jgi:hypothetical protein